ncbi:hypothetical protein [Variovorax sp. PCZ-1]|uniref:hypothetical protein n=1 Tax=Variovorax sp. PCZ-1 TaxID=2835533 RepID=UPI001BCE86B8|nr:hypothetical protein [Variovorax sp. PCZ-1]MBS7807809.1 hypothetical protein [Variovorax sp. PCZ-1]
MNPTTPLDALSTALGPLRTHPFAYPTLEVIHIIGIALLLGNLVLLELRVWGFGKTLPVKDLSRLALLLAISGFSLAAFSGLIMFATQAGELLANRAFVIKMGLLMLAACNAAWFHGRDSLTKLDGLARLQTFASTLIWIAAIFCGRWIAYI